MERNVIYNIEKDDFESILRDIKLKEEESVLDRYYAKIVSTSTVAEIHDVSPRTVCRYAQKGIIPVANRSCSKGNYKFRLSEVLKLDFDKLRKAL